MPLTLEQTIKMSKIKDILERENQRQERSLARLRMLKDDFREAAKQQLKKYVSNDTWKKLCEMINCTINVYDTVISEISMIYNENPQRIFEPVNESETAAHHVEIIESIYKKNRINQKMKKANRYLNAVNTVALHPVFRKGTIAVDLLTPNVLSIEQDDEDLTAATLVAIRKEYVDSMSTKIGTAKHTVWTAESHYQVSGDFEKKSMNENDINPYGFLPFVFIHREVPDGNFWDETSGNDLYECTLIASCLQTLIDSYFVWNSFKQLAINSRDLPDGLAHAPDKVIHLESPDDSATVLDFTIALKELLESLRTYITSVAQNYGIDWNSLVLQAQEASGRALRIKSSKLQRLWNNQLEIFQDAETELFEQIKKIYYVHTGIDLQVEMKIKFSPMENYRDEREDLENLKAEMDFNLKDLVMIFMERNKGYKNYEEAKDKVAEIIKTNNEMKGLIDDPVDKILGGLNGNDNTGV